MLFRGPHQSRHPVLLAADLTTLKDGQRNTYPDRIRRSVSLAWYQYFEGGRQ